MGYHSGKRPNGNQGSILLDYRVNSQRPGFFADFANGRFLGLNKKRTLNQFGFAEPAGLATMVDSSGNLLWRPHNVLTYSQEFDNAAWTKQGSTVTANAAVAPDGTTTADRLVVNTTVPNNRLVRNVTMSAGAWSFAVFAKADDADWLFLQYGNSTDGFGGRFFDLANGVVGSNIGATINGSITSVGDGWYLCVGSRDDLTVAAGEVLLYTAEGDGDLTWASTGAGIFLWGAHLYRSDLGGMADVPTDLRVTPELTKYVPTTTTARYLPRFGHHVYSDGIWQNQGVLVERQARTNLLTYSNDFTNPTWVRLGCTITANQGVGPDGNATLDQINLTATAGPHGVYDFESVIQGATVSKTIYVRYTNYRYWYFRYYTDTGHWVTVLFDLASLSVLHRYTGVGSGTVVADSIEAVGDDGLLKLTLSASTASGTNGHFVFEAASGTSFTPDVNGGNDSWTPSGTETVHAGFCQMEAGSTPSSYIPTAGSSVERTADPALTFPAGFIPYAATGVSISMQGKFSYADEDSSNQVTFLEWGTPTAPYISWSMSTLADRTGEISFTQNSGAGDRTSLSRAREFTAGINQEYGLSARHLPSVVRGAVNTVTGTEVTDSVAMPDLTGVAVTVAGAGFMGTVRSVNIWPTDLEDVGLQQALTDAGILGIPIVLGIAEVGQALVATAADTFNLTDPAVSYQWQVSDDGVSGWRDIAGATGTTHVIAQAQLRKRVRVVQTVVASGVTYTAASSETISIDAVNSTAVRNLFSANSGDYTGTMLDFTKTSRLFSDFIGAGAGAGDTLALVLDDSQDGAEEEVTNSNTNNAAASNGWTGSAATITQAGSALRFTGTGIGSMSFNFVDPNDGMAFRAAAGDFIRYRVRVTVISSATFSFRVVNAASGSRTVAQTDAAGSVTYSGYVRIFGSSDSISIEGFSSGRIVDVEILELKRVPGSHAVQSSVASRPAVSTDAFGTPLAQTDGVDDGMLLPTGLAGDGTKHIHVFAAASVDTGNSGQYSTIFGIGSGSSFSLQQAANPVFARLFTAQTGALDYARPLTDFETCIRSAIFSPSAQLSARINGAEVRAAASPPAALNDLSVETTNILHRAYAGTCHGIVLLVGDRAMTTAEIATVEAYLASLASDTLLTADADTVLSRVFRPATDLNVTDDFDTDLGGFVNAVANGSTVTLGSGTMLVTSTAGGAQAQARKTYRVRVGQKYRVTIDRVADGFGAGLVQVGDGSNIAAYYSTGRNAGDTTEVDLVATTSKVVVNLYSPGVSETAEFDFVSIEEIAATGDYWDLLDDTRMYSDLAGTLVEAEDPVQLLLPKGRAELYGPELVANGDFATGDLTGWTEDANNEATVSAGVLSWSSQILGVYQQINVTAGHTHKLTVGTATGSETRVLIRNGRTGGTIHFFAVVASGETIFFTPDQSTVVVSLNTNNTSASGTFDNISVKRVLGYPLRQTSAASRPLLSYAPNALLQNIASYLKSTETGTLYGPYAANNKDPDFVADFTAPDADYFRVAGSDSDFATAFTDDSEGGGLATQNDSSGNLVWRAHNLIANSNEINGGTNLTAVPAEDYEVSSGLSINRLEVSTASGGVAAFHNRQNPLPLPNPSVYPIRHYCLARAGEIPCIALYSNYPINGQRAKFNLSTVTVLHNDFADASITDLGDGLCLISVDIAAGGWGGTTDPSWYLTNDTSATNTTTLDGNQSVGDGLWLGALSFVRNDLGGMADNPDPVATGLEKYVPTTTAARYLTRRRHHRWDGTAWVPSCLHEPVGATNLVTESRDFSTWTQSGGHTIAANAVGIDGQPNTARSITDDTPTGGQIFEEMTGLTSGGDYACAFHVKKNSSIGGAYPGLSIQLVGGANTLYGVVFDPSDGSYKDMTGTSRASPSATYVVDAGEYWRVIVVVSGFAFSGFGRASIEAAYNTTYATTKDNAATGGAVFDQVDFTAGLLPSSPIITNGSTVTRTADTLKGRAASLPYSSTAMSIAMSGGLFRASGQTTEVFAWGTGITNVLSIYTAGNAIRAYMRSALGAEQANDGDIAGGTPGAFNVAARYVASGELQSASNGAAGTAETATTPPMPTVSAADFEPFGGIVVSKLNGAVDTIRLWDEDIGTTGIEQATATKYTVLEDLSGNSAGPIINGTLSRTAVAAGTNIVAYSGFTGSNYFESADDYFDPGTGDWSITRVLRKMDTGDWVFEYGQIGGAAIRLYGVNYSATTGSQLRAFLTDGTLFSFGDSVSRVGPPGSNEWAVVTLARRSNVLEIWFDGALDKEIAINPSLASLSGGVMRTGGDLTGGTTEAYGGDISSIMLDANYAPTEAEITALHADLAAIHAGENADFSYSRLVFDGVDDYFEAVDPDGDLAITGDLTIVSAGYTSASTAGQVIATAGDAASFTTDVAYNAGYDSSADQRFIQADATNNEQELNSASVIVNDSDTVLTFRRSGSTIEMTQDLTGVETDTFSTVTSPTAGSSPIFVVGTNIAASGAFLDGGQKVLAVIDRALSTGLLLHLERALQNKIS